MKVGIDIRSSREFKTGIGSYVANLIDGFQGCDRIQLLLYGHTGKSDLNTPQRMFWENVTLPRETRKDNLDIFHFPGFAGTIIRGRVRKITTVHDLIGMIYPGNLGRASRFYWAKWLPVCVRNSDKIIAVSHKTKSDIVRLLGIPEERIRVIHSASGRNFGVILDKVFLDKIKEKYTLPDNFMLNVGTIEPRKNIPLLLESFADYIRGAGSDLMLVICGKKDWGYEAVLDKIEALGIADKIKFTDYVQEGDMAALYNLCKMFVFPSTYEGFGFPVLEALACGKPVICSNTSSLPEVAGEAAIYVDPLSRREIKKAIDQLDNDPDMRESLSARALEQASEFSWERTVRETIGVYEEVFGG